MLKTVLNDKFPKVIGNETLFTWELTYTLRNQYSMEKILLKSHLNHAENHAGPNTIINNNHPTEFHCKLLSNDEDLPNRV